MMHPVQLLISLYLLSLVCTCNGGLFGAVDHANTDSGDCKTCKKLRFCKGFLGQKAADCAGDDEDEDAEDKWEGRIGVACNAEAYKEYVCVRKMDPCDGEGKVIPVCRDACIAGKLSCENKTRTSATDSCEGLPTDRCWGDADTFLSCNAAPCTALDYCKRYEGTSSLHCDGEWRAKAAVEDLLSSGLKFKQPKCTEAFVRDYLCHKHLRPCDGTRVPQKACFADCYKYHHHCLGQSETVTMRHCQSHSTFYCDRIVTAHGETETQAKAWFRDSSRTSDMLVTILLVFCLIQVGLVHYLRDSAPSLNFLRQRRIM